MPGRTQVEQLAEFVHHATYSDLSNPALARLKLHLLDTVGCAIGALDSEPPRAVRRSLERFSPDEHGPCTFIGGGSGAPDRAALVNGALVRYLDFMDNFLAPKQTCHPCDTFAAVLAAAETADLGGSEFLVCMAVGYQVFCRLIEEAPVQEAGFDHTVQLAYGVAAGASRALGLSIEQTAHALALAGASAQGLVITRAEYLSNWKGLQSADVAMSAFTCVLLAREGITGPLQVLDGKEGYPKAFKQTVRIDWQRESLDIILRCSIKAHNAEVHTQPVLEAVLALREQHQLAGRLAEIERIEVEVFKQAYDITGAGEEAGNKYDVRTKEQADHSLPYLVAVALLDGEVTPRQFVSDRILKTDVQQLLHKVRTLRDDQFTKRYPQETPCRVVVELKQERALACEATDWLGFFNRPMSWSQVREKFDSLAMSHTDAADRNRLAELISHLEDTPVRSLTACLATVGKGKRV
ncbi:MAG TPA: MmgE/PrpD family protein [Steroidobacteraceae bacterium]|nr:MmgE/PrpD family protein [Steroidobacteraceae bacterium]